MTQILESELIIKGSDKTGAAFAGVIKHAEELKKTLAGLHGMRIGGADFAAANTAIREQTSLLNNELRAVQAINRATQLGNAELVQRTALLGRMRQRVGAMGAGMGAPAMMAGGYLAGRSAVAVVHAAADFEHERAVLAGASGMKPAEVAAAVDRAMSLRVPMMSATDNLKAIGELRMVLGSTEHAIANVEAMQRAAAVLKAINPNKDASAEAYDLARALELKGVSMDPAHFTRLTDRMVQAVNASRGKVTGEGFFEFTQYSRGAARYLSDDFYTRVAPSLIQEMRPTSAGRAISSLYQQVIGGKMSNRAAQEWVKLGLIDPHKVIYTKTGSVKGVQPGAFVDAAGFMADPYAWIQKHLAPALKKHGFTDDAKIGEEVAHLFSNMYAAQMAQILLTQKQRIEKDWGLIEQAPGNDALEKLRGIDPKAAFHDLAAGLNSLLGALGSPLVGQAPYILNALADSARYLAAGMTELAKDHPFAGAAVSAGVFGGLGVGGIMGLRAVFGLATGATALRGSAVALTQSAASLDAAAARLGAGGAASVAKNAAAGAGVGLGVISGIGAVLAAGAAGTAYMISKYPEYFDTDNPYARPDLPANSDFLRPENRGPLKRWTGEELREASQDGAGAVAGLSGSAEITSKITVEPSHDFMTRIETMITNAIHGIQVNGAPPSGTSGSTGPSMPELTAPFQQ